MKRYYKKNPDSRVEYIDVISETEDGYMIRMTRLSDGNEKIIEQAISRHLFNICLKTGFIYEAVQEATSVA